MSSDLAAPGTESRFLPAIAHRRNQVLAATAVTCAYLIGATLFWLPEIPLIRTHLPEGSPQFWTTLWQLSRTAAGGNPLAEAVGVGVAVEPLPPRLFLSALAAVVRLGLPLATVYNLAVILGITVAGLAAHGLGRALSGSHAGGFVAGAIYAGSPLQLGAALDGNLRWGGAALVPLYVWACVAFLRGPSWGKALLCSVLLLGGGLTLPTTATAAGLIGTGLFVWQLAAGRTRPALLLAASIGIVWGVSLLFVPADNDLQHARRELPQLGVSAFAELDRFREGLIDPERVDDALVKRVQTMGIVERSATIESLNVGGFWSGRARYSLGPLALGVGLLGLAVAGRRAVGWAVIASIGVALAWGPVLRFGPDETTGVFPDWVLSPYLLAVRALPRFDPACSPAVLLLVPLACCAALGAAGWGVWFTGKKPIESWLSCVVVVLSFGWPSFGIPASERVDRLPLPPPGPYSALRALTPGGVLHVPVRPATTRSGSFARFLQSIHGHPVFSPPFLPWVDVERAAIADFVKNDVVRRFSAAQTKSGDEVFAADQFRNLVKMGLSYVVVRTEVPIAEASFELGKPSPELLAEPGFSFLHSALGPALIETGGVRVHGLSGQLQRSTWDRSGVVDLRFALDFADFGLWVSLDEDSFFSLYEGEARALSLWLSSAVPTSVALRIRADGKSRTVVIAVEPDVWRWHRVEITEMVPVRISIEAENARTKFRFTRAQVSL